jgi:hypothetical protein
VWDAPPGSAFLLCAWLVGALCALCSLTFASMALLGEPGDGRRWRYRRAGVSLLLVPALGVLGFAGALLGEEGRRSLDGAALLFAMFFAAGAGALVYRADRRTPPDS